MYDDLGTSLHSLSLRDIVRAKTTRKQTKNNATTVPVFTILMYI